jgi:hypothetical protein
MSDIQESHPGEDELLELSLGALSSGPEAAVLHHLNTCLPCRSSYDEISRTLDATLPASPEIAPPAGFEARVLDRIGIREAAKRPTGRRVPLLVAAAAVAGLLVGGLTAVAIQGSDSPPAATPGNNVDLLRTASGSRVGSVLQSRYEGRDVLVMHIEAGPPGMHYSCRLRLADGSTRTTAEWTVPESGTAVWIVNQPSSATGVELVTDSGKVWSTADLRE